MCLHTRKAHYIATRDIPVIKEVCVTEHGFYSPVYGFEYKLGQRYVTQLNAEVTHDKVFPIAVKEGFHSFNRKHYSSERLDIGWQSNDWEWKNSAQLESEILKHVCRIPYYAGPWGIVVLMNGYIPKGATVYEGYLEDYASNQIVLTGTVQKLDLKMLV